MELRKWLYAALVIGNVAMSLRTEGSITKGEWMILAFLIAIMCTSEKSKKSVS